MAQQKKVLTRIHITQSIQKVTQAMKMVSVAKLEQVKRKRAYMGLYARKLRGIWQRILSLSPVGTYGDYFVKRPVKNELCLVFSGDKGLCGSFNHGILREVKRYYGMNKRVDNQIDFLPFGNRVKGYLQKKGLPYIVSDVDLLKGDPDEVQGFMGLLKGYFLSGKYDRIVALYQESASGAPPCIEEIFPMCLPEKMGGDLVEHVLCEPDSMSILDCLFPELLCLQMGEIALKSAVGEHKSRMVAMSQASDNADKLLRKLRLIYNRIRQENITKGIIEVTAGLIY